MYNIVVMDCDLISSFAKINRIDLLGRYSRMLNWRSLRLYTTNC